MFKTYLSNGKNISIVFVKSEYKFKFASSGYQEIMVKKYTIGLFFVLALSASIVILAQDGKTNTAQKTELNFYPNPVSDGKIYITSATTSNKEVEIFDVLGKSVLKATVVKELNISSLDPGVYLIKIKDGENSVTRKLVVK